jgi:hypothetical protein
MNRIKCFFIKPTRKKRPRVIQWSDGKKQTVNDTLYERIDTGELDILSGFGPGAMWFAPWLDDIYCKPQLEHTLVVKTPGGDWVIDSCARNCTIPDDHKQEKHHCWIIEGTVPPDITVGKNGPTCGAGAGSIWAGKYHGFLRNGYLEEC